MLDSLRAAATAMGARFDGDDRTFNAPVTDSRKITTGDLFFAMRGEAMDGHVFVEKALAEGAAAVVVDHDMQSEVPHAVGRQLIVNDTRLALGLLGGFARRSVDTPLIAVTGNSGKTTVKEMVKSILSEMTGDEDTVLATLGNLNSYVGVPQTLCRLRERHAYGVVELGASHVGEIAWTSPLVMPQVAVITNVTGAHVGEFGGLSRIAQAKSELFVGLAPGGKAVINRDDTFYPVWCQIAQLHCEKDAILDFGLNREAMIHADEIASDQHARYGFKLVIEGRRAGRVQLRLMGEHNVRNALAAAAATYALGISPEVIIRGLENVDSARGRMHLCEGQQGRILLDDTYNANPGACRAAIDTLSLQPAPRWFLMGAMGELGADAPRLHKEIGEYAKHKGIDGLITFGEGAQPAAEVFGGNTYGRWDEFVSAVDAALPANASVLIKGSRSTQLERMVEHLSALPEEGEVVSMSSTDNPKNVNR